MFNLLRILFILFASVLVTVSACEDDCQDGITNAILLRYQQGPLDQVFNNITEQIRTSFGIVPNSQQAADYLVQPLKDAYNKVAYDNLHLALFEYFFHGKCQQDGVDPPGCPNPDCPVVCGTPGSIVHFYPLFRYKAYNATQHTCSLASDSKSDPFNEVLQRIKDADKPDTFSQTRGSLLYPRSTRYRTPELLKKRKTDDIKAKLVNILSQIKPLLESSCGGSGDGQTNGLPLCSWEREMKNYILSFP